MKHHCCNLHIFSDEPEHIFEVFAEVGRPTEPNGVAFVLQNYPEEIQDKVSNYNAHCFWIVP